MTSTSLPNIEAKSADYYDRNAELYLNNNQSPSDFVDEFLYLLRHGNDSKNADAKKSILDLGCGPGVNAAYMESKNFHVVGLDLSNNMVEHARMEHPHIEFVLADMTDPSFPPESFDGIFASYSIIHLTKEKVPAVLARLNKILRPGGIIYVSVQSGKSSEGFYSHPLTPSESLFLNIFSKDEIFHLLSKYGFEIVTQHEKLPIGKVFNFTKLFILAKKAS